MPLWRFQGVFSVPFFEFTVSDFEKQKNMKLGNESLFPLKIAFFAIVRKSVLLLFDRNEIGSLK